MKIESLAEQLLFSTVRIELNGPSGSGSGTGFIFSYSTSDGQQALFLVTNKHVIQDSDRASFFFTLADAEDKPIVGQRFDVEMDGLPDRWHGHPDPKVDIAITPFVPILQAIDAAGKRVFFRAIPHSAIPTQEQLEQLDAIEEVLFIGYPNGIYDQLNLLPVTRRGVTATPFQVDHDGQPRFLIDASVFGGSSGSPVFILNQGGYAQRGGFVVGSRIFFLGVVASVAFEEQYGRIEFRGVPTSYTPVPVMPQMLDLGIVFKSSTVVETVEDCLRAHGAI